MSKQSSLKQKLASFVFAAGVPFMAFADDASAGDVNSRDAGTVQSVADSGDKVEYAQERYWSFIKNRAEAVKGLSSSDDRLMPGILEKGPSGGEITYNWFNKYLDWEQNTKGLLKTYIAVIVPEGEEPTKLFQRTEYGRYFDDIIRGVQDVILEKKDKGAFVDAVVYTHADTDKTYDNGDTLEGKIIVFMADHPPAVYDSPEELYKNLSSAFELNQHVTRPAEFADNASNLSASGDLSRIEL